MTLREIGEAFGEALMRDMRLIETTPIWDWPIYMVVICAAVACPMMVGAVRAGIDLMALGRDYWKVQSGADGGEPTRPGRALVACMRPRGIIAGFFFLSFLAWLLIMLVLRLTGVDWRALGGTGIPAPVILCLLSAGVGGLGVPALRRELYRQERGRRKTGREKN